MRSSASVRDVAAWIEDLAPPSLAESWDKVGLQIGDGSRDVTTVMTALTLTHEVLDQAIHHDVQLIVAHHPLIFQPLAAIDPGTRVGGLITRLVRADIALFVAHTNLDAAVGGVSDGLARRLGLSHVSPLDPKWSAELNGRMTQYGDDMTDNTLPLEGIGRVGRLASPISMSSFIERVKTALSLKHVKLVGPMSRQVRVVAVVGGSGGSFIKTAHNCGADVLVTGDIDFHDADEALALDIGVVDAGHFGTEKHVPVDLADYLRLRAKESGVRLDVLVATESDPFEIT